MLGGLDRRLLAGYSRLELAGLGCCSEACGPTLVDCCWSATLVARRGSKEKGASLLVSVLSSRLAARVLGLRLETAGSLAEEDRGRALLLLAQWAVSGSYGVALFLCAGSNGGPSRVAAADGGTVVVV